MGLYYPLFLDRMVADELAIGSDVSTNFTAIATSLNNINGDQLGDGILALRHMSSDSVGSNQYIAASVDSDALGLLAVDTQHCAVSMLSADAPGRAIAEDGWAILTKCAAGFNQIVIGTMTPNNGSGDNEIVVASGHSTDIVIFLKDGNNRTWIAAPGLADPSDVWKFWDNGAIGARMTAAIQQDEGGFTILNDKCHGDAGDPNNGTVADSIHYISITLAA